MKDRKGMSSRKYRFSDLFWILCISFFVTGIWARAAETSPNVVVIFLDDSSWADFQPLGDPFYETPNVEYSNDMWRFHPTNPEHWGKFPLQFWDRGEVTIKDVSQEDQTQLTTWATENAVDFIERNQGQPFFLYLAHSMPHVPLFCSDKFLEKSGGRTLWRCYHGVGLVRRRSDEGSDGKWFGRECHRGFQFR